MQVRTAKDSDLLAIADIERECFSNPWSLKMLQESYNVGTYYAVAESEGKIFGYGGLYPNGDITNIAVMSDYRGSGIGGRILDELIEYAKKSGVDKIFLEVGVSNKPALRLYKRKGFKKIDLRKRYYENGDDAEIYLLEVN